MACFDNVVFCLTGTLSIPRKDFTTLITTNGGIVKDSVTKAVTHLVCSDSSTEKASKAKAKGVTIVDEDWVHQQIGGGGKIKAKSAPAAKKEPVAKKSQKEPPAAKQKAPPAKATKGRKKQEKVKEEEAEEEKEPMDEQEDMIAPAAVKRKNNVPHEDVAAKKGKVVHVVDRLCHIANGTVYEDWDVMLNQTNIGNNNNKFYVIQVIQSGNSFWAWNRWGRVGEPGASATQGPFGSADEAQQSFRKKFKDKTGNSWEQRATFTPRAGKYSIVKLKETREVEAPAAAAKGKGKAVDVPAKAASKLDKAVQDLISLIFAEASSSLTTSLDAMITENGIETPLGVLSAEQVRVGEGILDQALAVFNDPKAKNKAATLQSLSSDYYTAIPHRFGRQRPPVLNSLQMFHQESELLELMSDMVGKAKNVLYKPHVDDQYASLNAEVRHIKAASKEFKDVAKQVQASQLNSHGREVVDIKNIFSVRREEELKQFTDSIPNQRTLFHGSRISNWVGLLGRGILLPKVVVKMGVHRTDPGWLGSGIYFGEADTAAGYAGSSQKTRTAFMLGVKVALGNMKEYKKITYGLAAPPSGFHSCHGVMGTEFYDNEYVVYDQNQQKTEYLIEFTK